MDDILAKLIDRGWLSGGAVTDDDLRVSHLARRNCNLRFEWANSNGFLFKQPEAESGTAWCTLRQEIQFYRSVQAMTRLHPIRAFLPNLLYSDIDAAELAINLIDASSSLWDYHAQYAPNDLPLDACNELGRAVATVHSTFARSETISQMDWLRRDRPWSFQIHRPDPELLETISPANYRTLAILQSQPRTNSQLDEIADMWTPSTLIHSDLKSENLLVRASPGESVHVYLIDWEAVQIGDPAWDIAGVLQDFILFWINSMRRDTSPEKLPESAKYLPSSLQPLIRAFWNAYLKQISADAASELLLRATRFSAVRLIQSTFERALNADLLQPDSILMLNVGSDILMEPEQAQVKIFGLASGVG